MVHTKNFVLITALFAWMLHLEAMDRWTIGRERDKLFTSIEEK